MSLLFIQDRIDMFLEIKFIYQRAKWILSVDDLFCLVAHVWAPTGQNQDQTQGPILQSDHFMQPEQGQSKAATSTYF